MSKEQQQIDANAAPAALPLATGSARFRCNKCGMVVVRDYGWKLWGKTFCYSTGKDARLYRVSSPNKKVSHAEGRSP